MKKPYLTAKELAARLKCSADFVYRHKGEFGAVTIGTLVRFPADCLVTRFEKRA